MKLGEEDFGLISERAEFLLLIPPPEDTSNANATAVPATDPVSAEAVAAAEAAAAGF